MVLIVRTEFDLVLVALYTAARSVTPTLPRKPEFRGQR